MDTGHRSRIPELDRGRAGWLPRALLSIALALPVLVVVGVLIGSKMISREPPSADTVRLPVAAVPVPDAATADCSRFFSGLPDAIETGGRLLPRRVLADPSPPATAAWGGETADSPPVILRCGLSKPAEMGPTAPLLDVDGVSWLSIRDPNRPATTWVTADRAVYVGLTLPDGVGSAAIQDVSRGVKITLSSRPTGG